MDHTHIIMLLLVLFGHLFLFQGFVEMERNSFSVIGHQMEMAEKGRN